MDFKSGAALIAIKILSRGKGIYIIITTSSLLLYYPIFMKNPRITYLLVVISVLNALVAILADIDTHKSLFYAFRICGATPSTLMAYIITTSSVVTLISLIPIITCINVFGVFTSLLMNISVTMSLLYMSYIKVKKYS
jgi:hypothetical protein